MTVWANPIWRHVAAVALVAALAACDGSPLGREAIDPPPLPAAAKPPPPGAALALAVEADVQECGQARLMLDRLVKYAPGSIVYGGGNSIAVEDGVWTSLPVQARRQIMRSVASAGACPDPPDADTPVVVRALRSQRMLAQAKAGELN